MEERLIKEVKMIKHKIPWQTYKTLIGQIRAGDLNGAEVGIGRLKRKIARKEAGYAHSNR